MCLYSMKLIDGKTLIDFGKMESLWEDMLGNMIMK